MARHALQGSERQPLPGAKAIGKADPTERLEVSVILRSRAGDALRDKVHKLAGRDRSEGYVKREDFAKQFGADPKDIDAVKHFAAVHDLATVASTRRAAPSCCPARSPRSTRPLAWTCSSSSTRPAPIAGAPARSSFPMS